MLVGFAAALAERDDLAARSRKTHPGRVDYSWAAPRATAATTSSLHFWAGRDHVVNAYLTAAIAECRVVKHTANLALTSLTVIYTCPGRGAPATPRVGVEPINPLALYGRLHQHGGINDYHRNCLPVVQAIRIGDLMPAPGRQPSPGSVAANLSSVLAMAVAAVGFVAAGALALVFAVFATAAHAIGQKLGLITKDESGEPVDSMWLGLLPFLLVVLVCFGLAALMTATR